jgi:lipopolysaccharide/colanic/teichoic acid biosynthesis glycosyltransferase
MAKRTLDVVGSILGLLVLSPLFLALAVAIKLDSPGPVFFTQERLGRGGRPFRILKFRSMVRNADRVATNVSPAGDPRITRVGRFLRKYYLDELPQLINVLKGDMSLVGPRPETPEFVALYTPEEWQVLTVRPGIAGPSTLAFMDEADLLDQAADPEAFYVVAVMHERVRLDLEYLGRRSFVYDVRLMVKQLVAVFRKVLS